jgi:hypothetical protein
MRVLLIVVPHHQDLQFSSCQQFCHTIEYCNLQIYELMWIVHADSFLYKKNYLGTSIHYIAVMKATILPDR